MTADVLTVAPTADACTVAERLHATEAGSLVVCESGRPVGIVTDSDVVDLVATGRDPDATLVRSFMSTDLLTIAPEATVEAAARLLEENDIRRLPVVDGEELVGIVTSTDLSYFLPRLTDRHRRAAAGDRPGPTDPADLDPADREDWQVEVPDAPVEVGDVVRFRNRLTDDDVCGFASSTGDTNPLHLDDEFAALTRFGGRIAHGMLTAGVVSAALAHLPGLVVYLGQDLRFLGPVAVDEEVTAVCRVVEDLGGGRYELTTTVYDADGERVVDGEATVLVEELPEGREGAPGEAEATS